MGTTLEAPAKMTSAALIDEVVDDAFSTASMALSRDGKSGFWST